MYISEFGFNLLLIFFPGIICAYMVDMFTNHPERTPFQFAVNAFLLGLGSYLLYAALVYLYDPDEAIDKIFILPVLMYDMARIWPWEIIKVCGISVLLAILLIGINTYKLHFRLLQKCKITRKFGEQDVWGLLMDAPSTEWLTVRDMKNNLMYQGWLKAFSDSSQEAELLLRDVIVYNNTTGELLYEVDVLYLPLNREHISIEVSQVKQEEVIHEK